MNADKIIIVGCEFQRVDAHALAAAVAQTEQYHPPVLVVEDRRLPGAEMAFKIENTLTSSDYTTTMGYESYTPPAEPFFMGLRKYRRNARR